MQDFAETGEANILYSAIAPNCPVFLRWYGVFFIAAVGEAWYNNARPFLYLIALLLPFGQNRKA
ncbi:MAG: hypothetical protein LUE22_10330 [Oscillospiraceae bacterium]|nr:hypothetical protein [Oscillospiraceae bacterium]